MVDATTVGTTVAAKASFLTSLSTNIYFWIIAAFSILALFLLAIIFIIVVFKKSHAGVELKGWLKGRPISMFFQENRYVDWKVLKPEAGIIIDKNYGGFIINERATYIDKKTKNVIIPFDAQFGASINIHAAKLADDLQYIMKDEEEMASLRSHIANNTIDENETIDVLKTSVSIGAIKTMMTALIPHNINSKIEKILAQRMKNYGKVDVAQLIFLFCAMLGAIIFRGNDCSIYVQMKHCMECGNEHAPKGSYNFPFCERCYKKKFNNSKLKYINFLQKEYNGTDNPIIDRV